MPVLSGRGVLPAAVGIAFGTVFLLTAQAQTAAPTASQITPQTFRPPVTGRSGALDIPEGAGLQAPAGAEKLKIKLSGVKVEGGLPALAEITAAIEAKLTGRTITAADIFAAARELE